MVSKKNFVIVFSRFGYSQATMDAIAAEEQFSKATIYKYFENKSARSMLGALIRGFHFRGPLLQGKYTTEESVDIIIDFFLNGIRNRDSRQKEI